MKKSSFWDLEVVTKVISSLGISLKNWYWFSSSLNINGFFNWIEIDFIDFKLCREWTVWDCLIFGKMEVISFK